MKKFLRILTAIGLSLVFTAAAWAAQCMGITREGRQCKNNAGPSGYCHYHNPGNTNRCAARTKDGSPCRNNAQSGSVYCYVHK